MRSCLLFHYNITVLMVSGIFLGSTSRKERPQKVRKGVFVAGKKEISYSDLPMLAN